MVDLGDDLDVMAAVAAEIAGLLAEKLIECPQVGRATVDGQVGDISEGVERSLAAARDHDPGRAAWHL